MLANTHKIPALMLAVFFFTAIPPQVSAECSTRKNALGNLEYRCSDGRKGQLRKDALERWQDTESRTTYRTTPLGNVQGSDGTHYRKDALGHYRSNDGKVYRKDALGNWQSESR